MKEIRTRWVRDLLEEDDYTTSDGKYYDAFWFRGLEDGTAIANIDSSEFDPFLEVYGEDGRLIVRNDDGGAGDDARASFRVGFGKSYRIVVTSAGPGATGRYDLNVSAELAFDSVITRSPLTRQPAAEVRPELLGREGFQQK